MSKDAPFFRDKSQQREVKNVTNNVLLIAAP